MKILVTGGAGFIGSHLCDALLARGNEVWCLDNFWLGSERNIAHMLLGKNFHFEQIDLLMQDQLSQLFDKVKFDFVFHLAANSDIRAGSEDPSLDLRLNFHTTLNLLEVMRANEVSKLFFASTSAIFGENTLLLNESSGPLQPISFYGSSKLAAEAYISVYAYTHGIHSTILRFPNVVGERATHGAIYDFFAKLKKTPERLEVLGNGKQSKPYVYIGDLVDAILLATRSQESRLQVYHVAGEGLTSVHEIAELVVARSLNPRALIDFTGGDRGWPGDVPYFSYDTSLIRKLGWCPRFNSTQAVAQAINKIIENGF